MISGCAHMYMGPEDKTHPIAVEFVEAAACGTSLYVYNKAEEKTERMTFWFIGSTCVISLIGDVIMETAERLDN